MGKYVADENGWLIWKDGLTYTQDDYERSELDKEKVSPSASSNNLPLDE